ncbi:MAG: 50S ribosomal protein L24 [Acidobacteriia bacterium]|nr:50S ribosomal protein L24 [Terriglobia bacterium]
MPVPSIRRNDTVKVITGRDKGKTGKVLKVLPQESRLVVENVMFIKRHTRPNPGKNIKGGIVEREMAIHVSNVLLICPSCNQATRVGHQLLQDGSKVRVCKKCAATLEH